MTPVTWFLTFSYHDSSSVLSLLNETINNYIYIYIPCKFNSCNQLQVFYPLNLSWNNEGTSLTWAWNCSLASCPINFEPLRGP